MDLRRIVLLGNKGFIGSHLEAGLRQLGLEYVNCDLPDVDLTKSADNLPFDEHTAVVMTAGVKRQWGDTLDAFQQNVAMAVNVARALEKRSVSRFIFFSSAAVYGEENHNEHITEDTLIRPTSLYGAAKFASECVFSKTLPTGFVAVRPPLIYGPGDASKSYGPAGFVHAAKNRELVTLWGEGDEKREFVFVADMVQIVARLVSHDFTGVLNIATGQAHTFREAAELAGATIATRPRSKPKVDHGFDNRRLTKLFPDFTFQSLAEGIHETLSAL
jgi:UDP-glucose 4-epimerase